MELIEKIKELVIAAEGELSHFSMFWKHPISAKQQQSNEDEIIRRRVNQIVFITLNPDKPLWDWTGCPDYLSRFEVEKKESKGGSETGMKAKEIKAFVIGGKTAFRVDGKLGIRIVDNNNPGDWSAITLDRACGKVGELQAEMEFYQALIACGVFVETPNQERD